MDADSATEPLRIDVRSDDAVIVTWADGHVSRFDLVTLRRSCTCAECRDLRENDRPLWPKPGAPERLKVEHAELIGAWGLNLHWNDGHQTGVYRWDSLRAWCRCDECRSR